MVGELPDPAKAGRLGFAATATRGAWPGGTGPRRSRVRAGQARGEPLPDALPEIDMDHCVGVLAAIRDAVRAGELSSCHDIAEGGFLVALAEACLAGGRGASLHTRGRARSARTGSSSARSRAGFIVSGPREALDRLGERIPLDVFGTVGGDALELDADAGPALDARRAAHRARRARAAVSLS
jgi:phosphoribosylformylglycinamidine synthase